MPTKLRYFDPKYCLGKNMVCSRKYNGFGFIWTGKQFLSLNFKPFNSNLKLHISYPVQGEFWIDDSLSKVSQIVTRDIPNDEDWKKVKIIVYNIFPEFLIPIEYLNLYEYVSKPVFRNYTYRETLEILKATFPTEKNVLIPEFIPFCNSYDKITDIKQNALLLTQGIREKKWEGYVIQNLDSFYEDELIHGRSKNTLKIKPNSESNCVIIGFEPGQKRNENKIGSLICAKEWTDEVLSFPNGQELFIGQCISFSVSGLTDEERELSFNKNMKHFKVGQKINFTFKYISDNAVPQNCNLLREI
jgi:hypothetical protein